MQTVTIEFIGSSWRQTIHESIRESSGEVLLMAPFIKKGAIETILDMAGTRPVRVVTRFNLADMYTGVSDLSALEILLDYGAQIRGLKDLHSKVYAFGLERAVITSANLTVAGLSSNHEFGVMVDESKSVKECIDYFERQWSIAGESLSKRAWRKWSSILAEANARCTPTEIWPPLPDFGAAAPMPRLQRTSAVNARLHVADEVPSFIKLWGHAGNRASLSMSVHEEVIRSESYFACAYPLKKKPASVKNGSVIYMGRLMTKPNDIRIFGRAVAIRHDDHFDFASQKAILRRDFKEKWGVYVRVHRPEFIDGTLKDGVSLNLLKEQLGSRLFQTTVLNEMNGFGNLNPNRAYSQQAQVMLSLEGHRALTEAFDDAIEARGSIPESTWNGLPRD